MRDARWAMAVAAVALAGTTAACGSDDKQAEAKTKVIPEGTPGAVVFRDALRDNRNGWLEVPQTPFRGGSYVWNDVPTATVGSAPDKLRGKQLPAGVAVGVRVEQRDGAALRMVTCRESGADGSPDHAAYQLGVDGRQAVIRLWHEVGRPPEVLARKPLALANGTAATLDARCLQTGDGAMALSLRVDGKKIVQASQAKPLPNGGVSLQATARGDTDRPPSLAWNQFVVRRLR